MANQRTTDDTMSLVNERKKERFDPMQDIIERRWGHVKDVKNARAITVQWFPKGTDEWKKQLFKLKIGKEDAVISRQELEMLLRFT